MCVFFGRSFEMQAKTPCGALIGWMTGPECDGRSTINFPVVGKGRGVTALWSTIKRTRQIEEQGRRSAGEHREQGQTKTGMEMQLHITQRRTKGLRQLSDTTATPADTHILTGMHTNSSVADSTESISELLQHNNSSKFPSGCRDNIQVIR